MQIIVDIPNDSDELYELEEIVKEINKLNPNNPTMTAQLYVSNIVMGYFQNRVKNVFIKHIENLSLKQMKAKVGKFKTIRGKE